MEDGDIRVTRGRAALLSSPTASPPQTPRIDVWYILCEFDGSPVGRRDYVTVDSTSYVANVAREIKKEREKSLRDIDAAMLEVYLCKDTSCKFSNRNKAIVTDEILRVLSNESIGIYLDSSESLMGMKEGETLVVQKPGMDSPSFSAPFGFHALLSFLLCTLRSC